MPPKVTFESKFPITEFITDLNGEDNYKLLENLSDLLGSETKILKDINDAFHICISKGFCKCIQSLLMHGASLHALVKIHELHNISIGSSHLVSIDDEISPLHLACLCERENVIELLLGVTGIEQTLTSVTRQSALIIISSISTWSNLRFVDVLLRKWPEAINNRDYLGKTALMHAIETGKVKIYIDV